MDPDGIGGCFPHPNQVYNANPINSALSQANRSSLSQVNRLEEGSSSPPTPPLLLLPSVMVGGLTRPITPPPIGGPLWWMMPHLAWQTGLPYPKQTGHPTHWVAHPMAAIFHGTSLSCFACPLTQPDQASDIFTPQLMNVSTKNPSLPSSTMWDGLSIFYHVQTSIFSFGPT
jgi:hypothetical protein